MDIKDKTETEFYNALYSENQVKNEYIYKDRRDSRRHKTIKIVIAVIISSIPAIGSLLQAIAKLLA